MNWVRKHRPSPATAIALAALVVALGGAAFAAIPDSNGTIHGCFQKNSGNLRVVESSSGCRSDEQAIDWSQGESSSVRALKPFSLSPGERRLLFQAGTVTFTAFCLFTTETFPGGENRANVEVTTSQDHAAVEMESGHNANRDLRTGQTWTLPGSSAARTQPDIFDWTFSADSPDGTNATGIISTGLNQRRNVGKCQFGGQVAVAKES